MCGIDARRGGPQGLVKRVVARGRGNPFFTNELVAAHLSGEDIPVVLSDLISAEIADLDDTARLVLGVSCRSAARPVTGGSPPSSTWRRPNWRTPLR